MTRMAKIDLPYVQRFKDRHGCWRHYYRRPGFARLPLPGVPGSAEFMAAYAEADARAPRIDPAAKRVQPKSVNALVIEYYRSASFKALRPSTAAPYRRMLDKFRARHGDKTVANIQTAHLNHIFHQMAETPHAAANLRKRLRKVFQLAVRLGWRPDNPVRETEIDLVVTKGHAPWSEDDIATFLAHWGPGTRERLALSLLLYTGQRRSDVVGMGAQHVKNGRISVVQTKTSARLSIRIHPALQAEISRLPKAMTFLTTQYGKPFSPVGFSQWFVERAEMAGVFGRTPHGLRKAAGRRLAEAGCSAKEIGAITGHRTLSEIENYTRDADQERLADSAIARLEGANREQAV